ncbi:MAG: DUF2190 family protein [Oligoflexales bacterium]
MKNYVQKGHTLTIKAPYYIESGQLVILDSLFGVAIVDALSGEEVTISTRGIYELDKDNQAISQGQKAYYLEDSKQLTTLESHLEGEEEVSHPLIGIFVLDAKAEDKKAQVKLAAAPC